MSSVIKLRELLSRILNISAVVSQTITNHGRTGDWKSLKKTVYSCFLICEMCAAFSVENVKSTVLEELGKFSTDEITIKGILFALDKIVDLDGVEAKKRFIVKEGLDPALDEKRENLYELTHSYKAMSPDETLMNRSDDQNSFHFVHFPEMGFVIGTEKSAKTLKLEAMENDGIELVL
jgi:DNA mismatch repair ATPase MutS